jgi:uncharacterized SAM-binding protein YcdF (DUF218 family)
MSSTQIAVGIVRTIILPPLSLFLLAAGGWMLQGRRPRLGRALIGLALLGLFALCTEFGARLLVRPLEGLTVPLRSSADAQAQAIVVLAAGRLENAPEYGSRDIPDYLALGRLRYAAKLQHETGLPILVSGGNRGIDPNSASKADEMARALREDFLTPVKWIEGNSATTAENARFSATILRHAGVRRILLVTDAMHMPRARMAFGRTGVEVVPAPTMFFATGPVGFLDFVPTAEGLRRSCYALYEWLGLLWYWTRNEAEAR